MFTSRLMRDEDAYLQFEVMAWLINSFGPPKAPSVPSPIHRTEQLSDLYWDEANDSRPVHDWAEDTFAHIKTECDMDNWSVQIAPYDIPPEERTPFSQSWNMADKETYYVDGYGRPVIHYDPNNCLKPGYFASLIILKMAELRLMSFIPEFGVSPLMSGILTLTTACYMRQGFALANLPEVVSEYLTHETDTKAVPQRIIENTLAFSSCLVLLSRKQTPEQIVAGYGTIMSKGFRKKIRPACKQISNYDSEIKVMQMLTNPKISDFDQRTYVSQPREVYA